MPVDAKPTVKDEPQIDPESRRTHAPHGPAIQSCPICGRDRAPRDEGAVGDGRCHRGFDAYGDVDTLAAHDCIEAARA